MSLPTVRFESTYFAPTLEEVMAKVEAGRGKFTETVHKVEEDKVYITEVSDDSEVTLSDEGMTSFEATLTMKGW